MTQALLTPAIPTDARTAEAELLISELSALRSGMLSTSSSAGDLLRAVDADRIDSAQNLLHYLALRRRDLRPLQDRLTALGLSSLGRAEPHVLATVDAVLTALHAFVGRPVPAEWSAHARDFHKGPHLLAAQAERLMGRPSPGRDVRILVTMPREAADDYMLVHDLLQQGMNRMRINCAHDDPARWLRMIEHLRRAEQVVGTSCRVLMDVAGPKLRTGPIEPGPAVVKIRPVRDLLGRVLVPARIWLTDQESPQPAPSEADASLHVPGAWLSELSEGDRITFRDARAARRTLRVVDVTRAGCWAEAVKTAYIVTGTRLRRHGDGRTDDRTARVAELPPLESAIPLRQGDTIVVTRGDVPGRPARWNGGRLLTPASVGCTLDRVFEDVHAGEAIWFDDGAIGGVIEQVSADHLRVRITNAHPEGTLLRADKGINLPDSRLHLLALTAKDEQDLGFIVQHADIVALSFASSARDVALLQEHLTKLDGRRPAIVLKIETRQGFEHLPEMLLEAMRDPCCGVMVARGDLAVECGFERLAEVQEEMLWICEAAHVPLIWATQVLEHLAKDGMPSRAEVTDAAMANRAECVMLNKGPHVVRAVQVLDDILRRMASHQTKKRSRLRELKLAHGLD
jgi:pyruvate kinase